MGRLLGSRDLLSWILTSGLAAAGVVAGRGMAPQTGWHWAGPAAAAVLLLAFAGQLIDLPLTVRGHGMSMSPTNCVVILGVVYADRLALVAVIALSLWTWGAVEHLPPVKTAFNMCNTVLGAVLAAVVFDAVLRHGSPAGVRGWVAIAAATLAFDVATTAALVAVVALQGALSTERLSAFLLPLALAPAVNIVLSIVAVDATLSNPWALIFVVLIPAGVDLGFRYHLRMAGRFANLERLYQFTQRVSGLSEERDVLHAVLAGLCEALSCEVAQLVTAAERSVVAYELRPPRAVTVSHREGLPPIANQLEDDRNELLLPKGADGPLGEALAAQGFADAIAVRLAGEEGVARYLVVGDREGAGTFSRPDLRFVETLAAQSALALRGTRLLDELRTQVTIREYDALHDSLTQLGNRGLFAQATADALANRPPGSLVGVLLLDLDGFKDINDTLGHPVGDIVLQKVAARIRRRVGPGGVPTRLGGDEFAVVLPDVEDLAALRRIAEQIFEAIGEPLAIEGLSLNVRTSIGMAVGPDHGDDTSSLLKAADVAMYAAKSSAERISIYDLAGDHNSTRRLLLASELRLAVRRDELALHYQPKVDMSTGEVLGFEALLRWHHAVFGDISPVEFVPAAEQSGLIDTIMWWALRESLEQQRKWARAGFDVSVAVNVSARSLLDTRLAARIGDMLAELGVPAGRLILEVTESSVMADGARSAAILRAAAALGVRIAVDDFGTGYSSLSRLLQMPVHEIKVDRSFVSTMLGSADNRAIVSSTVNLALSMGRSVTAEGIEDRDTWEALRALGCHAAQGYFIARPMPAAATTTWLRSCQAHTSAADWLEQART